ncbi:MAG: YkoF family thiamine/hydroxymethylpyrimidine-binding protein [Flavobacteriales bacterium]
MRITIEISMYPLREEYEPAIIEFINELKSVDGLSIRVNPTATHIFGEYDVIFDSLKSCIRHSFEKYGKAVFVLKVLNGDLEKSLEGSDL